MIDDMIIGKDTYKVEYRDTKTQIMLRDSAGKPK